MFSFRYHCYQGAVLTSLEDVTQPDISIRELEERWGLSRNGLKSRAKALGVELIRVSSTCTVWPGAYVELGDRLHEHLSAGAPMATFPGLAPTDAKSVSSAITSSTKKESELAGMAAALVSAIAPLTAVPADPLSRAKGLAEAADHALVLTTDELVALGVKGVDGFADGDEAYGYAFSKHRQRNRTLWTVEWTIGTSNLAGPEAVQSNGPRSVGFAAHISPQANGFNLFAQTTIC